MPSVRVITGTAKGRKLQSLKGQKTRPTADRVKESLFSILGDRVRAGWFLDLYAGSGAIGIEALSRGASGAIFIDNSRAAVRILKGNLDRVDLESKAEVYATDVLRGIAALAARDMEFSCIFLDPPYDQGKVTPTLMALSQACLVAADTIVVAEHSQGETVPEQVDSLDKVRVQVYGDTVLSFFRCRG